MMKRKILYVTIIFVLLIFVTLSLFLWKFEKQTNQNSFKVFQTGLFYRIFPWDEYQAASDWFYSYQEFIPIKEPDLSEDLSISNPDVFPFVPDVATPVVRKPWGQLFASLTGSSGAVSVSGSSKNASFIVNGENVGSSFSTGFGSSFSIILQDANDNKKTIMVSSPSFATNRTVQSLSIGIDPYAMYVTLTGSVNLDLPGAITGVLYNTTNGASGSTTLQNGYFSLSVPLSTGINQITASGKWMTIELQLPCISVTIAP